MKFLITARQKPVPQSPAPLEVYKAAYQYVKTRLENGTFDCFYSFPSFGGMIIANVETPEELWLEIFGYPLAAGYDWEVQPLADTLFLLGKASGIN